MSVVGLILWHRPAEPSTDWCPRLMKSVGCVVGNPSHTGYWKRSGHVGSNTGSVFGGFVAHLRTVIIYFFVPCGKIGLPGKAQQPQEQRCPFLSVCVVFSCGQTMIWLPVWGSFNVRTDTDVHAIAHGAVLYGHRKRVCTES